jgi:hypothetical protein
MNAIRHPDMRTHLKLNAMTRARLANHAGAQLEAFAKVRAVTIIAKAKPKDRGHPLPSLTRGYRRRQAQATRSTAKAKPIRASVPSMIASCVHRDG